LRPLTIRDQYRSQKNRKRNNSAVSLYPSLESFCTVLPLTFFMLQPTDPDWDEYNYGFIFDNHKGLL